MMLSCTIFSRPAVAFVSSIHSGWNQWSCGMSPNSTGPETTLEMRVLNSSENGSSLRNVQGYRNLLLNLSSSSRTLRIALSTSLFRASMRIVAFARRSSGEGLVPVVGALTGPPTAMSAPGGGDCLLPQGILEAMFESEVASP